MLPLRLCAPPPGLRFLQPPRLSLSLTVCVRLSICTPRGPLQHPAAAEAGWVVAWSAAWCWIGDGRGQGHIANTLH